MNRWFLYITILFHVLLLLQNGLVNGETCLHNERSKCTQTRNANEIKSSENDQCHHLCIQTGHASGHCSLASNCFQYCLCNEKEL